MGYNRTGRRLYGQSYAQPYGMGAVAAVGGHRKRPLPFGPGASRKRLSGRRIPYGSGSETVTRRRQNQGGGDYTQISVARLNTGRKQPLTLENLAKQVNARNELTIYRWNGMKSFDDNGYYFCGKFDQTATGRKYMPCYMYDLTGVINTTPASGVIGQQALSRMYVQNTTGYVGWEPYQHLLSDGSTSSTTVSLESASTSSTAVNYPHQKSFLKWHDVRMNLWGAKTKAVKWVVQVVKLTDEAMDPWTPKPSPGSGNSDGEYQAFWQSMVKPYAYNPIAVVNPLMNRKIKVLRTYSTIIQPTSSFENDADPHVKTLRWFMRWDRTVDYSQSNRFLGTGGDVANQADFIQEEAAYGSTSTDSKSKLFLLVRCQSPTEVTTEVNTDSPSFDLMVRAAHLAQ